MTVNVLLRAYVEKPKRIRLERKPKPLTKPFLVSHLTLHCLWRPRRDLNPCRRRERPVSWARLDDGDVLVSRAGFEPATLCLKVLAGGKQETTPY